MWKCYNMDHMCHYCVRSSYFWIHERGAWMCGRLCSVWRTPVYMCIGGGGRAVSVRAQAWEIFAYRLMCLVQVGAISEMPYLPGAWRERTVGMIRLQLGCVFRDGNIRL